MLGPGGLSVPLRPPGIPSVGLSAGEEFLDGPYVKHNCANGWLPSGNQGPPGLVSALRRVLGVPPRPDDASSVARLRRAFTHFTWTASRGQLMVIDLQGVNDDSQRVPPGHDDGRVYTDPVILSGDGVVGWFPRG